MFENILGNQKIKEKLKKSINEDKILHSYLFIGIEGIGKKLIAKEFAKAILCLNDIKYCNNCKSCIEFSSNNNPDFLYIEPDGNNIKIEQIREMQKKIQEKPIISQKKVYIIDNADQMTQEAQNCLLKTLEEPPEFATIILLGNNESAFLPTIKSRCMILSCKPIQDSELKTFLEQNYGMKNITQNMLDRFQGSVGKAIELKDKEEYQKLEEIIAKLQESDLITTLKNELDEMHKEGVQIHFIGDLTRLSEKLQKVTANAVEMTKNNTGVVLQIALNYGARDEIVNAVKHIISDNIVPEQITPELISDYLYTKGIPDPDILIRTGGEKRISNYLLWQIAYSEIIVKNDYWPEFDKKLLKDCIEEFNTRQRRYGK